MRSNSRAKSPNSSEAWLLVRTERSPCRTAAAALCNAVSGRMIRPIMRDAIAVIISAKTTVTKTKKFRKRRTVMRRSSVTSSAQR